MSKSVKSLKLDSFCGPAERRSLKRHKHRVERRRAKSSPDCAPCYTKFKGWAS